MRYNHVTETLKVETQEDWDEFWASFEDFDLADLLGKDDFAISFGTDKDGTIIYYREIRNSGGKKN